MVILNISENISIIFMWGIILVSFFKGHMICSCGVLGLLGHRSVDLCWQVPEDVAAQEFISEPLTLFPLWMTFNIICLFLCGANFKGEGCDKFYWFGAF